MVKITEIKNIAVLGDGGWGTTLAILLAKKGYGVRLWGAFKDNILSISKTRVNRKFLNGIKVPASVELTAELDAAVKSADLLVLAIPSQFIRKVLRRLKALNVSGIPILSVAKGIETGTLMRISQVIRQELGRDTKLSVLSGPTIAIEVAKGLPATAVISAHKDRMLAETMQYIFTTDRFRIYTNSDMAGVELGGSLKNVIAIACGISDGLGFAANAKAALLCRGLVEISRLGHAMGARKETFSGISGLGDLVTTCISCNSRNRFVGEQIGRGRRLKDIVSRMNAVAEGVATAKSAYLLSKKYNVSMPITEEVYAVLYKDKNPRRAVNDLMVREMRGE